MRHVLTAAIGSLDDRVVPQVQRYRLSHGDQLLLCTDGLTEMVDDELIAKVLREPAFPASELEQLKNESITRFESQRKEPNNLAVITLLRQGNPYPRGDVRYQRDFDEAIADTRAVTLDAVRQFHRDFYGADHGEMAVVGDFDPAAIKALAGQLFGDWKAPRGYTRVPTPVYAVAPTEIKIETPDKANAYFTTRLQFALQDTDADYPAALIANYATGGGPGAILWKRIREKEGVSYDVRSILTVSPYEKTATWTGSAIYAPQNLARVQQGFREEVASARDKGFTAEQLADAKKGLLQARRLQRAQDGALAATLANELELERTMQFDAKIDAAIEALTLDQVNAAFRKYVDPSQLVTVYAGDFAKSAK